MNQLNIHLAAVAEQIVSPEESSCPRWPVGRRGVS